VRTWFFTSLLIVSFRRTCPWKKKADALILDIARKKARPLVCILA